jgi:hypothetical protein
MSNLAPFGRARTSGLSGGVQRAVSTGGPQETGPFEVQGQPWALGLSSGRRQAPAFMSDSRRVDIGMQRVHDVWRRKKPKLNG